MSRAICAACQSMMAVVSVGSLWSKKMCAVDSPVIAPRSRASVQTSNFKAIQGHEGRSTSHSRTVLKDHLHPRGFGRQARRWGFHDGGTNNANDMDVSKLALSRSISTQTSLRKTPGVTLPNRCKLRGQMPADAEWYTYASKRCLLLTGPNAERF